MAAVPAGLATALQDRYRLDRELGQGGMATVYLARDVRHDRDVALKVLRPELGAVLGTERFLAEIRITARLDHPHILTLIDSGEAGGLLYYVLPFIRGESLRDKLNRQQQLGVEEALAITRQVAGALDHAHQHGVVHRDIKPENILLHEGEAMLADFGIALAVSEAGGGRLTETGLSLGTPQYMSPEQATGDRNLTAQSDVYSLAAVLYEMLAGEPPVTGPNAQAIIAKLMTERPVSLRVVRDTVPKAVDLAVQKALAKVPADRFASAGGFAEALLHEPPRTDQVRRLGSAAAALLVLGITAAALWRWWPGGAGGSQHPGDAPLEAQRLAVLYLEPRGDDPDLAAVADGLTEGLIDSLRLVKPLEVISSGGVSRYRGAPVVVDRIVSELKIESVITGSVSRLGDRFQVAIQLLDGYTGAASEPRTFEATLSDVLPMEGALARGVVTLLKGRPRGQGQASAWILVQRAQGLRKQGETAADSGNLPAMLLAFATADSLARQAASLDGKSAEPLVLRALLAYRRSYFLGQSDPQLAAPWIDSGLVRIAEAIALGANNPNALEVRGNLRYWRWLLGLEGDSTKAHALLGNAQADLEQATRLSPSQAGAWATLSHLYNQTKTGVDVSLAARRAYEADPYISNADKVLNRLFLASYDIGEFTEARHWCDEGVRRFPGNTPILQCRLLLLTTKAEKPDVDRAWRLRDSLIVLTPAPDRRFQSLYFRIMVAGVIGRAGLVDSASRVVERSRGDPSVDPQGDLAMVSAFAYVLMGNQAKAIERLKTYFASNPGRRETFKDGSGWWFRDLQNNPAYQRLIGGS